MTEVPMNNVMNNVFDYPYTYEPVEIQENSHVHIYVLIVACVNRGIDIIILKLKCNHCKRLTNEHTVQNCVTETSHKDGCSTTEMFVTSPRICILTSTL